MVAPPIGYGASGEHESFPGTVSIGTSALRLLLVEFGRSAASWARRLVFVNGHGGNVEALAAAAALLRYEGRDVGWCSCGVENADAHAGHTETSVLLHISPDDVRTDERVPGNSAPLAELLPAMRSGGVAAVSELGVLGDPTTATASRRRTPVCRDGRRMRRPDSALETRPRRDADMSQPRLPDGFAVQVDRRVKVLGEGSALLGGSPTRLLKLAPAAQTMLTGGRLEVHDALSAQVARTLLDATVAHPRPAERAVTS